MRRTSVLAIALTVMLGLTACAPAQQPSNETTAPSGSASETTQPTPVPAETFVTIAYSDSYKTIFHLDAEQIATASGTDLTADSIDAVATALAPASVWQADSQTAPYADLIATAFGRETDSTREALHAVLNDDARLKIYVGHNSNAEIAHIQTEHDN